MNQNVTLSAWHARGNRFDSDILHLVARVSAKVETLFLFMVTALIIFVIAWGFQFWGHSIEGRKPSFFKDVQFLLIGPMWVLSKMYRKVGLG
jgi:uncharacterized membrane protein YGL010W